MNDVKRLFLAHQNKTVHERVACTEGRVNLLFTEQDKKDFRSYPSFFKRPVTSRKPFGSYDIYQKACKRA